MINHNLPDSPDAGNRCSDDEVKQMLLDRAEVMALRQLPDSLCMNDNDSNFLCNLRRGIVINQALPARTDGKDSYTQQLLRKYSWLLSKLSQQGKSFFENPDTPGSLATEFEQLIDTVIEQSNTARSAHFNSFLLQLKEQLEFIEKPKNKTIGFGFIMTIGTEAYARYYFAYTDLAKAILKIIEEKGTDYDDLELEEYRELVKAYLIISSLVDAGDPYEHQIDPAQ